MKWIIIQAEMGKVYLNSYIFDPLTNKSTIYVMQNLLEFILKNLNKVEFIYINA